MKKIKTLIIAIVAIIAMSQVVSSCSPYWYDDGPGYEHRHGGRPGPPPPPPPGRHGHGW